MPSLQITTKQLVELIRQLPPEERRAALVALASDSAGWRDERMEQADSLV